MKDRRQGLQLAIGVYTGHRANWIYFALLLICGGYSLYTGALFRQAWIMLAVFAGTPILEYFTHKYVLHFPMPRDRQKHPLWYEIMHRIHYAHHEDPKAIAHIFAPWWFTLPFFLLYTGGVYLISGQRPLTAVFATGLILYFLIYEWTHYMAHCDAYAPRNRYSRFLKKFHSWHHYKSEAHWYGITSPLADLCLGQWKAPKTVEASPLALKNRGRE